MMIRSTNFVSTRFFVCLSSGRFGQCDFVSKIERKISSFTLCSLLGLGKYLKIVPTDLKEVLSTMFNRRVVIAMFCKGDNRGFHNLCHDLVLCSEFRHDIKSHKINEYSFNYCIGSQMQQLCIEIFFLHTKNT